MTQKHRKTDKSVQAGFHTLNTHLEISRERLCKNPGPTMENDLSRCRFGVLTLQVFEEWYDILKDRYRKHLVYMRRWESTSLDQRKQIGITSNMSVSLD